MVIVSTMFPPMIRTFSKMNSLVFLSKASSMSPYLGLFRTKYTMPTKLERGQEGTLLHKVDALQKMFVWGHRAKTRYTSPWCVWNSKKPLSPDIVHEALVHLQRKYPVYQVAITEYDGDLWWYKPNNMDIDFKVLEKGTPKHEARINLWKEGFNESRGPLWKTRFIPAESDDPCLMPEIKKDYPYQYYVLSTTHHALGDGMTVAGMLQPLLDMVNAVIERDDIDDNLPLGVFLSNEEYTNIESTMKEKLLEDPERLESLKKKVLKFDKSPLLSKGVPRPGGNDPMTKHLTLKVGKDVFHRFIANCKTNGVTFGSGFQNIYNTAMVELIQEAGSSDDRYDVSVYLPVNIRRYMKKQELPILGLHSRATVSAINFGKDVRGEFWENCRKVQDANSRILKSGAIMEYDVVRQLFVPTVPPEDFYKTLPPLTRDYGFNNLGDLNRLIPGTGKHVQMTDIVQYTEVHRFICTFFTNFFTFRGNFSCSMSYATDWLSEDMASELANKIVRLTDHYSQP